MAETVDDAYRTLSSVEVAEPQLKTTATE